MKSNKLFIFAIITIVVIVAATLMSRHRAPTTTLQKQTLFPGLLEKVNNVDSLVLEKQGRALTLSQNASSWGIEQADNYPADFGKIRETVIAVADLQVLAEKTSNADLYKRLGVEDPILENSTSLRLSLLDANGNSLANLIVGNSRHSKSSSDKDGLYVRLPDSETALLVEGRLDVSVDVKEWFKRELFNIGSNRIQSVHIAHSDSGSVKLDRNEDVGDFILHELPDDMEMQSDVIISRMGTILEDIFVDNIIKADKLAEAEQIIATIQTFDGLSVTIVSAEIDGSNYSSFSFAANENISGENNVDVEDAEKQDNEETDPSESEEAKSLNTIMSGWAYAIPDFKYELFVRKLDQLSRKTGSTEEASGEDKSEAK
jgi:Domain of unknown function (DUF4340)